MHKTPIHYFINSNSSRGFISFYDSNFAPLETTITLSAWPSDARKALFDKIISKAESKQIYYEVLHHWLDNSLEGIILPEKSTGIIHIYPYEPLMHSGAGLIKECSETADFLKKAQQYSEEAISIHDEWEQVYIKNMNFDTLDKLAQTTIIRLLDSHLPETARKPGKIVTRYFGAGTKNGPIDYINVITADIDKRYFIKGRPGTGKSTFLKKIAQAAADRGWNVEAYRCAFDPNSFDMTLIRDLGICIFDSTSPHEYFPTHSSDEIIDIYQAAVTPNTDEKYSEKLLDIQSRYKAAVAKGTDCLQKAYEQSCLLEQKLMSQTDPDTIKNNIEQIVNQLFI